MESKNIVLFCVMMLFASCSHQGQSTNGTADNVVTEKDSIVSPDMEVEGALPTHTEKDGTAYCDDVERKDTLGLIILYPTFSKVDLVCGSTPSKDDRSVILFAEAAYTGELLDTFKHSNVAGDHVSAGQRYKGFKCKRNTGAFVYYSGKWKFCHHNYSNEMDLAAQHGGCAFGQELVIHNGKLVETPRKDGNMNLFRVLCDHQGKLCIVESEGIIRFGDFKKKLLDIGISDAIYLDMGIGWNHAWYRSKGKIVELHPKFHDFCTNWITFYK